MWMRLAAWIGLAYATLLLVVGGVMAAGFLVAGVTHPPTSQDVLDAVRGMGFAAMVWLVFYAPWLLGWPWCALRLPMLETRTRGLLVGAAVVAALGGAGFRALGPRLLHTAPWIEAAVMLTAAVLLPWLALTLPRLTVRAVRPGVFRDRNTDGAS